MFVGLQPVAVVSNTLESFYIYKETKAEKHINDKLTAKGNEILEAILQHEPLDGYTAL